MELVRCLKNVRFIYNFEKKALEIIMIAPRNFLTRDEMFSLQIFIARVARKGSRKNRQLALIK